MKISQCRTLQRSRITSLNQKLSDEHTGCSSRRWSVQQERLKVPSRSAFEHIYYLNLSSLIHTEHKARLINLHERASFPFFMRFLSFQIGLKKISSLQCNHIHRTTAVRIWLALSLLSSLFIHVNWDLTGSKHESQLKAPSVRVLRQMFENKQRNLLSNRNFQMTKKSFL